MILTYKIQNNEVIITVPGEIKPGTYLLKKATNLQAHEHPTGNTYYFQRELIEKPAGKLINVSRQHLQRRFR